MSKEAAMNEQAKQVSNPDSDRAMAEHVMRMSRRAALEACRQAADRLARFAADAQREVQQLEQDERASAAQVVALPGKVLHAAVWGLSNANSDLDNAMRRMGEFMRAVGQVEALSAKE